MHPRPPLIIREAVDTDGPGLSSMIAKIFADYEGVRFIPHEFPELAAPASFFAAHGGRLLVGEAEGEILASFGVVSTHHRETAEFLKVYVARKLRGDGTAKRLLHLALDQARSAGARQISLWSDLKFVEGHRFYQRNGFRRGPGVRAIHDASETLEINFRLDVIPSGELR